MVLVSCANEKKFNIGLFLEVMTERRQLGNVQTEKHRNLTFHSPVYLNVKALLTPQSIVAFNALFEMLPVLRYKGYCQWNYL